MRFARELLQVIKHHVSSIADDDNCCQENSGSDEEEEHVRRGCDETLAAATPRQEGTQRAHPYACEHEYKGSQEDLHDGRFIPSGDGEEENVAPPRHRCDLDIRFPRDYFR